jgi:hypothetical protein
MPGPDYLPARRRDAHPRAMSRGTQLSSHEGRRRAWPGRRLGPDSGWWIVAVAAAFTAAQILFVSPRMGLSWDETVYVSQVSAHAPTAYFDPARARGISLLVAPVALVTSSVIALRLYLAFLAGLGLLAALWVWRPLRPAWVLALAGVAFAGLWVALYYGPQAMPDEWVALSGLAAVGFFLRAAARPPRRAALSGLAVSLAVAGLFRPGDAAFLAATLMVAVIVVGKWRQWPLLACVVAGTAVGGAEWVIEAYLRFGGPLARLHAASREQGGFGLHLGLWDELRALNGPTWRYPVISLWWLALPVLVTLGVLAARRAGQLGSSALPAVCAFGVAFQYLFLLNYAAPRFLLPAYALLAIPAADCLAWLINGIRADLRPVTTVIVAAALTGQLILQAVVLNHEASGTVIFHDDYQRIAADLRHLGIRPPCLIKGEQSIPIAYYAGCASAGPAKRALASGRPIAVLAYSSHRRPHRLRGWHSHRLPGTHILRLTAYLPTTHATTSP